MGNILFYLFDAILIVFCVVHIIVYIADSDYDPPFLLTVITSLILAITAMIIYIRTDGGSFIPAVLLVINSLLASRIIRKRI